MLVLTIRTDKPEAEIGLFDGETRLAYETWQAHRLLAETLHQKIKDMLDSQGEGMEDIEAVVGFQGPGSFTGLRIGLSVVNALGASYKVPVVGVTGDDWVSLGIKKLQTSDVATSVVLPEYGAPVFTTSPRK